MAGAGLWLSDLLKSGTFGKAGDALAKGKTAVLEAKVLDLLVGAGNSKAELLVQGKRITVTLGDDVHLQKGDLIALQRGEDGALRLAKVKSGPLPQTGNGTISSTSTKPLEWTNQADQTKLNQPDQANPKQAEQTTQSEQKRPAERTTARLSTQGPLQTPRQTLRETLNFFLTQPRSPMAGLITLAEHLMQNPAMQSLVDRTSLFQSASMQRPEIQTPLSQNPLSQNPLSQNPLSQNSLSQIVESRDGTPLNTLKALQTVFLQSMHDVALKSEQADTDFFPRLLRQGGLLLEKKLAVEVSEKKPGTEGLKPLEDTRREAGPLIEKNASDSPNQQKRSEKSSLMPWEKSVSFDQKYDLKSDLKSIAMKLLAQVADNEKGRASEGEATTADQIKGFLQSVEKVQQLNSHLSDSGKYLIPFPIFDAGQFTFGQLYFDLGGKDGDGENRNSTSQRIFNVSLLLEMSALGPVRADFSMLDHYISGVFQVGDTEVAEFFDRMLPELVQRLEAHDYLVKGIACKLVPPQSLDEKSFFKDLLQDAASSKDGGLNVVI